VGPARAPRAGYCCIGTRTDWCCATPPARAKVSTALHCTALTTPLLCCSCLIIRHDSLQLSHFVLSAALFCCVAVCVPAVAVEELLESPELQRELQDVKAVADVQLLARFHQTLAEDQLRACYSQQEVEYADSQFAVDTLLVTDKLLLSPDFAKRKVLIALLDSVKEHGGSVSVLSSLHSTGAQLDLYTGIAALLRFPLHTEHLGAEAPAETRSAAELAAEQLDRELDDVAASMAFF
jgi:hypothetical protein